MQDPPASVFVIMDSDDDDDCPEKPQLNDQQTPLLAAAECAVGTVGCCGAFVMIFACLPCGMCKAEFKDTYNRFTFFGRCCPLR